MFYLIKLDHIRFSIKIYLFLLACICTILDGFILIFIGYNSSILTKLNKWDESKIYLFDLNFHFFSALGGLLSLFFLTNTNNESLILAAFITLVAFLVSIALINISSFFIYLITFSIICLSNGHLQNISVNSIVKKISEKYRAIFWGYAYFFSQFGKFLFACLIIKFNKEIKEGKIDITIFPIFTLIMIQIVFIIILLNLMKKRSVLKNKIKFHFENLENKLYENRIFILQNNSKGTLNILNKKNKEHENAKINNSIANGNLSSSNSIIENQGKNENSKNFNNREYNEEDLLSNNYANIGNNLQLHTDLTNKNCSEIRIKNIYKNDIKYSSESLITNKNGNIDGHTVLKNKYTLINKINKKYLSYQNNNNLESNYIACNTCHNRNFKCEICINAPTNVIEITNTNNENGNLFPLSDKIEKIHEGAYLPSKITLSKDCDYYIYNIKNSIKEIFARNILFHQFTLIFINFSLGIQFFSLINIFPHFHKDYNTFSKLSEEIFYSKLIHTIILFFFPLFFLIRNLTRKVMLLFSFICNLIINFLVLINCLNSTAFVHIFRFIWNISYITISLYNCEASPRKIRFLNTSIMNLFFKISCMIEILVIERLIAVNLYLPVTFNIIILGLDILLVNRLEFETHYKSLDQIEIELN